MGRSPLGGSLCCWVMLVAVLASLSAVIPGPPPGGAQLLPEAEQTLLAARHHKKNVSNITLGPTHGAFCPRTCEATTTTFIKALRQLDGGGKESLTWQGNDDCDASCPPTCQLCETPWLFIISLGGRTGSTTILNMLNGHPLIRLAGENGGTIVETTKRWAEMARFGYANNSEATQRGPVNPIDLLCDEQATYDDLTSPVRDMDGSTYIRGFKDISWSLAAISMLDRIFPCSERRPRGAESCGREGIRGSRGRK